MTTPAQNELREKASRLVEFIISEHYEGWHHEKEWTDRVLALINTQTQEQQAASKKAEDDRKRAIEAVQARIDHLRPHTAMFTHKHQDMDAHNNEIYIQGMEEALTILKAELSSPTERTKE